MVFTESSAVLLDRKMCGWAPVKSDSDMGGDPFMQLSLCVAGEGERAREREKEPEAPTTGANPFLLLRDRSGRKERASAPTASFSCARAPTTAFSCVRAPAPPSLARG